MDRLNVYSAGLASTFSVGSLAEGSEPISEAEEINEVQFLRVKGDKALKSKKYKEALKLYSEALEIDEKNKDILKTRAATLVKMKNYPPALKDTEILVQLCPEDAQAHYLHGLCLKSLKKSELALEEFLLALDLNPDQSDQLTTYIASTLSSFCHVSPDLLKAFKGMDPYKKLSEVGVCLFSNKKYELCVKVLEVSQKLRTNQKGITMRVLLTLGNAYSALKNGERAIGLFQECLSTASAIHDQLYQAMSLINIASLNQDIGDQQQAIVHYAKLLDLQAELRQEAGEEGKLPDFWNPELESAIHLNLSVSYKMIGSMSQALYHAKVYVNLLEKRDVIGQQRAEAYYNIGMLNVILFNYDDAVVNYNKFYDYAKKLNDKKLISQAYGCLGSVYAELENWQLAISYHQQDVSISKKHGEWKMISNAYEMMGDTLMLKSDYQEAVGAFEKMLETCKEKDDLLKAMAFCKMATAYKSMEKHQYSLYYYEQALAVVEGTEFQLVKVMCLFKMAQIFTDSSDAKELDRAVQYFQSLIKHFKTQIDKFKEESSFCDPSLDEQLQECFQGIQFVLVRLGNNDKAFQYLEASRERSILLLENFSSTTASKRLAWISGSNLPSIEKRLSCVTEQNSLLLYYSLLPKQLLLWVISPSGNLTKFYCSKVLEKGNLIEQFEDMLGELRRNCEGPGMITTSEHRALPRQMLRKKKKSNSEKSKSQEFDSLKNNVNRRLYNLLLAPIDDILAEFSRGASITVISDGCLAVCPFGCLQNPKGEYMKEKFSFFSLPSILALELVNKNQQEWLKFQDNVDFKRAQSRAGSRNKLISDYIQTNNFTGNGSTPETINEPVHPKPKQVSNPLLLRTGVSAKKSTSKPSNPVRKSTTFKQHISENNVSEGSSSPRNMTKLLHLDSITTVTTQTSTGTDITRSHCHVTPFSQIADKDRCLVIGPPQLPQRLQLNGKSWGPGEGLPVGKRESSLVASYLDVDPITGVESTKKRFLEEISQATIIHIVTFGSWEDGFLAMTPNDLDDLQDEEVKEHSYLITPADILELNMSAQLVVLSCGWSPYRQQEKIRDFKLTRAFLTAGAQCVLQTMWPVPNDVLEKFYHHFYCALQTECLLSSALSQAVSALQNDERFSDPSYWAGFTLIGKDALVDIKKVRHAMLDQQIDKVEKLVQTNTDVELLNTQQNSQNEMSKVERLERVQQYLATLLHGHRNNNNVLVSLVDLLDESLKRLHTTDNNRRTSRLERCVSQSSAAMHLLHLLDFHFQCKGPELERPYVIYPHWNHDDQLVPCYDALKASLEIVKSPQCVQTLFDLLPLTQDLISHLVDLISITKHAPEIQLKVSDMAVKPLWQKFKVKNFLLSLGYHQIATLLIFRCLPENRVLLTSALQFLLSISSEKSQVLLYRLDVAHLGKPSPERDFSSSEPWKLPSLGPTLLPSNQLCMSTPWLSVLEAPDEMETKVILAKKRRDISRRFNDSLDNARSWHQVTLSAQAKETLDCVGQPVVSPSKVKVKSGTTASQRRVPVDEKIPLGIPETAQRREYAHYLLDQRMENISREADRKVKKLFLPYIQAL